MNVVIASGLPDLTITLTPKEQVVLRAVLSNTTSSDDINVFKEWSESYPRINKLLNITDDEVAQTTIALFQAVEHVIDWGRS